MTNFFVPSDIEECIQELGATSDLFAGKTVLLTGGRGFLGRYFSLLFDKLNEARLEEPCRLVVVDNLITSGVAGTPFADSPQRRFIQHDVSLPLEVDEPIDYVVNAAGIASPQYYRAYPLETFDVAIAGSRNLLGLASEKGARYTFFSSSEIYGDPDPSHVPTPETYRGNVASQGERACYDEGKRAGETLAYIFNSYFEVSTTIVRPFNVYGPGMQEADYRVLPNFASAIKGHRPLSIYGSGGQTRSFCYITDALNGFVRAIALGGPGETYNIGNPFPEVSMAALAEHIETVLGRDLAFKFVEYPDSYPGDEPRRRCPDIGKARAELSFEPRVDLETGLRRFLTWTEQAYQGTVARADGVTATSAVGG